MENLINDFIEYKRIFSRKELSENTLKFYKAKIKRVFEVTQSNPQDLGDEEKMEEIWIKIAKLQIKTSTKVKFIVSLQQFSDFLKKRKIIKENEARKIPVPSYHNDLILPLTEEEIERCIYFIKQRWSGQLQERNLLIFRLLLYSGIRHSELIKLKKEDVFENRIIVHKGKGNKSRVVVLPTELGQEMYSYSKIIAQNGYIFPGRDGNIATDRFLCAIFKNIQKGTKIHIYPHKLRHTYASRCILAGLDIFTLKEQLGHADIRTTTSYMAITNERRIKEIQEKIKEQ